MKKFIAIFMIIFFFLVLRLNASSYIDVCIDPGHGGISVGEISYSRGTYGYQGNQPHEEIPVYFCSFFGFLFPLGRQSQSRQPDECLASKLAPNRTWFILTPS